MPGGKLLITGASGFVGYHLIEAALAAGYDVSAAVRGTSRTEHIRHLPVTFTSPDLHDADSLKREIAQNGYDYIIHAAGVTKARDEQHYNEVNAGYTANLAEAAAAFPVKKFVFISSLAALGPLPYTEQQPITEAHTPGPVTGYGRSKLLAEQRLSGIAGLPLVVLRPTAVYGPRERDILIMFRTLNRGLEPYIGRGAQYLSFVYVKDLAEVTIRALSSGAPGDVYNISDGRVYDRYALADITKRLLQKKTVKFHVPMGMVRMIAGVMEGLSRNGMPALNREKLQELAAENWSCSIEKARRELAYEPAYDLEAGLAETLQWYKANNWL